MPFSSSSSLLFSPVLLCREVGVDDIKIVVVDVVKVYHYIIDVVYVVLL